MSNQQAIVARKNLLLKGRNLKQACYPRLDSTVPETEIPPESDRRREERDEKAEKYRREMKTATRRRKREVHNPCA